MEKFAEHWTFYYRLCTHVIATLPETSVHINEKVTRSAAPFVPLCSAACARSGRATAQQSGDEI